MPLLILIMHIRPVVPAMVVMGLASFACDLSMAVAWDACVEIGEAYTATVAATMNLLGNMGGFLAPVVGGIIPQGESVGRQSRPT